MTNEPNGWEAGTLLTLIMGAFRRIRRVFGPGLREGGVVLALLLTTVAVAAAQSPLERVEELTRLGRAEEARTALMEWWDSDRDDASRRELQRGLWLRGRLTVDPVQAELDFQRLAVLYPTGQFTPDAVLRLAQAAWAMGKEDAARGHVASLQRDYPTSDARERAEAWLADAGPLPEAGDIATPIATPTRETPTREAPVAEVDTAPAGTSEAAGDPVMNYHVQLGAFADEARAFALYETVLADGVDVRVVRVAGSRFTHVRVGRFAERSAAVDLVEELAARGISAALVRDDRAESSAR